MGAGSLYKVIVRKPYGNHWPIKVLIAIETVNATGVERG